MTIAVGDRFGVLIEFSIEYFKSLLVVAGRHLIDAKAPTRLLMPERFEARMFESINCCCSIEMLARNDSVEPLFRLLPCQVCKNRAARDCCHTEQLWHRMAADKLRRYFGYCATSELFMRFRANWSQRYPEKTTEGSVALI